MRSLDAIGAGDPWRLLIVFAVWLGTAFVYLRATDDLSELEASAMWALCGLAAAGTILIVLLVLQMFIVPSDLHHQLRQEFGAAANDAASARLERVRVLFADHAALAPTATNRCTDTVDNWQRRAVLLLENHVIPGVCEKFIRCEPHCIQADLETSRASYEAIATNLTAGDLQKSLGSGDKDTPKTPAVAPEGPVTTDPSDQARPR